jgi:serine protease Do
VRRFFATFQKPAARVGAWVGSSLLLAVLLAATIHHPVPTPTSELARKVDSLEAELHQIKQETTMPALVLNRHRQSICFIYGVYSFNGTEAGRRTEPTNFSGTGFVVANGLIATNRHVAEPWFEDDEAAMLMRHGAKPHLEKLLAFFPNHRDGVELTGITVSPDADIAVAHFSTARAPDLAPLPLADAPAVPGAPVVLVGYPMGIAAMVAKSPRPVYRRLAYRRADIGLARELAELSLIRPSATQGHLGDVVGDKLIYDAVTAHGGSGGPVFNNRGEVIGVNTAYLDGFSGGTLGISVRALRPVIAAARQHQR